MPKETVPAETEMVSIPRKIFDELAKNTAVIKGGPIAYYMGQIYGWAGVDPSEIDSGNLVFMAGYHVAQRDNA